MVMAGYALIAVLVVGKGVGIWILSVLLVVTTRHRQPFGPKRSGLARGRA